MTHEDLTLRIITNKHWPGPVPGMLGQDGFRVISVSSVRYMVMAEEFRMAVFDHFHFVPDFKDPATLALLRGIVAKAHGGTQLMLRVVRESEGVVDVVVNVSDDYGNHKYGETFYCESGEPMLEALALVFENI